MTEPVVQTERLGRIYQTNNVDVVALASATCRVLPGDKIAVMGPSGSGKSTLLHLMGGLESPTSGTISWPAFGKSASLRPKLVSFVFQMQSLLAPLTVVENVEIPLIMQKVEAKLARAAAIDVLNRLSLGSLAVKLPEELSGGQAQRVAVARALVTRPKLILADEPTGQLDQRTAQQLMDVLLGVLAESDCALVLSTHDASIAGRLNTVWEIQDGVLEVQA